MHANKDTSVDRSYRPPRRTSRGLRAPHGVCIRQRDPPSCEGGARALAALPDNVSVPGVISDDAPDNNTQWPTASPNNPLLGPLV